MKPHIRGGKVLLIGGRIALVGCPEDCCDPLFPPWPPSDRPPWFDDGSPLPPSAGGCPTNCVGCGDCTEPCNPRPDGLYVRCCKPENPNQIVIRQSGTWELTESVVSPPGTRREVVVVDRTRTIVPGVSDTTTGVWNQKVFINGSLVQESDIDFIPSEDTCPLQDVIAQGPPNNFNRLCYGVHQFTGPAGGEANRPNLGLPGNFVETVLSDCRRGYYSYEFSGNDSAGNSGTISSRFFKQITYTPDPCRTPRGCDPNANGGFLP